MTDEIPQNIENSPLRYDMSLRANWADIPQMQKDSLVEKYGEPIIIPGTEIKIERYERAGVCDANEKSLAAMTADRLYWGYYNLGIVNHDIVYYRLGGNSRVLAGKIIVGENGGIMLPEEIYKEESYNGNETMADILYNQANICSLQNGKGTVRTVFLPESGNVFTFSALRSLYESYDVRVDGKNVNVRSQTVAQDLANMALAEAFANENDLYPKLYPDLPAYFENTEIVKTVETKKVIVRDGEINLPFDINTVTDPKRQKVVIEAGTKVQAIIDPIAKNNHGDGSYIIKYNGGYYFCPKDDCNIAS